MKVYAIDDDPLIRMMIHTLFSRAGHTVTVAATGEEGLMYAPAMPPDVVLLDLSLPDLSGLALLPDLLSLTGWEKTAVLMLTATNDMASLVEARQRGARGYVCKPVDPDVLVEMVQDIVQQKDLLWVDDYTRLRRPG